MENFDDDSDEPHMKDMDHIDQYIQNKAVPHMVTKESQNKVNVGMSNQKSDYEDVVMVDDDVDKSQSASNPEVELGLSKS